MWLLRPNPALRVSPSRGCSLRFRCITTSSSIFYQWSLGLKHQKQLQTPKDKFPPKGTRNEALVAFAYNLIHIISPSLLRRAVWLEKSIIISIWLWCPNLFSDCCTFYYFPGGTQRSTRTNEYRNELCVHIVLPLRTHYWHILLCVAKLVPLESM